MCTVTYLPLPNNNFIFTSNRDETPHRKTLKPEHYLEDGVALYYPKDKKAGGTWIGVSNKTRLVCLLNGAFENHIRKPPYKMSRGIVVKNTLKTKDLDKYLTEYDFENIEPFTLIVLDWEAGFVARELVWNGNTKFIKTLPKEPKIWSSSPLYNTKMKTERNKWFKNWIAKNNFRREDILKFHQNENLGSSENSIKMKRFLVETVSTSQIEKSGGNIDFTYYDYLSNSISKAQMI